MLNDKSGQLKENKHKHLAQHFIPPPNYTHQTIGVGNGGGTGVMCKFS